MIVEVFGKTDDAPATDVTGSWSIVALIKGMLGQLLSGITGNVAHDGVDAGNPVKTGGRAINAERTAVSNGDRADFVTDLTGKQIVLPYCNPENLVDGTGSATGTSDTPVIAAQGAGVRLYVTTLIIANLSSTDVSVAIKDGSTIKLTVPAAKNAGGAVITLPTPLKLTANTALNFASSSGVSTVYVSAVGYKGA